MSAPQTAPILSPDQVAERIEQARARGTTVALANGCFDLLHVGHVRYLTAASTEADMLVVAINDDESVARLKGAGRPLLAAAARAEMVAAIRCVDLVTVFSEPTADAIIRQLRPDVHCKGTDYAEGVPEAESVAAVGGRVAIVGDIKRHSTGNMIDAVRRRPR